MIDCGWKESIKERLLSKFRLSPRKKDENEGSKEAKAESITELEELLLKRDYSGAISLLEFWKREGNEDEFTELWLGYCSFHAGQYSKTIEIYEELLQKKSCPEEVQIYLACSYYFQNNIERAKELAEKGPKTSLQNRLLLHVYNRLEDEVRVKKCHAQLEETTEDMLALAAVHFQRSHYQEALDTYKRIQSNHRDYLALQVYLALCYYRLDYFDVASDTIQLYLSEHPDSPFALNLQACTRYKLYNSKAAERELQRIEEHCASNCLNMKNLIAHNKVVFRDGDGALMTLPSLVSTVPEARLNLIRFHLQRDDLQTAFKLFEGKEPQSPQEYLLQATTYYKMSIERKNQEYRRIAIKLFLTVGESASECDTVAGRQAMASAHFLSRQIDEALIYLDSIKAYFEDDDVFNYNFGQALLANGRSAEAEEVLLRISDQKLKSRLAYVMNLVRAYCLNNKGDLAWSLCSNYKNYEDLPAVLRVIANDCYGVEDYYHSALAFEALEQYDQSMLVWEGKKNAILGIIKKVIEGKAPNEQIKDAIHLLERDSHPHVEEILNTVLQFSEVNHIDIT